jgi:hypothetical protein
MEVALEVALEVAMKVAMKVAMEVAMKVAMEVALKVALEVALEVAKTPALNQWLFYSRIAQILVFHNTFDTCVQYVIETTFLLHQAEH